MKLLLEELGQDVEVATQGDEGLAKLLESRPDVAFVDVGLPGMSGYEIARRVRATPRGDSLYLVALTGHGGPVAEAKSMTSGFNRHITKPIELDDLVRALDRNA